MIPLRVLIIEDSESDASLILRYLERAGYAVEMVRIETESELIEVLNDSWQIIIADFQLPQFSANCALEVLQDSGKDIPFIVVSGAIGEETAVALMKSGARDYVMKDNLSKLPAVVERELLEVNIRQSQKQSHEALLESERNLKNSQQVAHIGHWVNDLITNQETWSDEMYRIFAVDPLKVSINYDYVWENSIHPDDKEMIHQYAQKLNKNLLVGEIECRIVRPDKSIRYILIRSGESEVDQNGCVIRTSGVVHDITDRKLIELNLREKIIESQNRALQLEIITFISSRMRQANSRQELVQILLEEMSKLFKADHAAIAFLQGDFLETDFIMTGQKFEQVNAKTRIGKQLKNILEERRVGFFEKIHPHAFREIPPWVYGNGQLPASMISYPIINKDKILGLFYMDFYSPQVFTNEKRILVNTIAEMAGNAFNRMAATHDLEAMVRLRERELESIYKVTSSASATLDLNHALCQALKLTIEAVHTSSGAVFLVDEFSSKLNTVSCQIDENLSENFLSHTAIEKILDKVVKTKKSLLVPNINYFDSKANKNYGSSDSSLIVLPMRAQDRVVGVLMVIHKNGDQIILEEMTLLSFIADHLALVVENSRSYKRAERVAVLEERSRLARELHDSVTQSLYSASLYSAGARRFFGLKKYSEVDSYLTNIGDLTQHALKEMRLLVFELRSPELKQNGLLGSLQNRLDAVERRSNIEAKINFENIEGLPEVVEENLYRIAIEALNNSLKYAQATKISVEMKSDNGVVLFNIQDNGVGFSIEEGLHNGGVGLATMRERAERINGTYEIYSSMGEGTNIEIKFLLK